MSDWKTELIQTVKERSPLKRGDLKIIINEITQKYGISEGTVKSFYYRYKSTESSPHKQLDIYDEIAITQKRNQEEEKTEPDKEVQPKTEDMQLLQSFRSLAGKPSIPPYKIGQLIGVQVSGFAPYGVFVETVDGNYYRGLIHISEIRDEYIDDLHKYFKLGDTFKARVVNVGKEKLGFSVKGLPIPNDQRANERGDHMKNTMLAEKLAPLKTQLEKSTEYKMEKDIAFIMKYLSGIVGMLSPKAMEKVNELIDKYGVFQFTVAMTEIAETFHIDPGLLFLEEVERKIGDGL